MSKELAAMQDRPTYLATVTTPARGSEGVGADDCIIPRLEIIQALSPVRQKSDPSYIKGAEEGMIFNTVTRELLQGPVAIVPVLFRKEYLVWKNRQKGGGFRGTFPTEMDAKAAMAELEDGADCEALDTAQHFCLLLSGDSERVQEVVISMSRTKMKVSRNLNSLVRLAGDDRFSRVYRFDTVLETNSKNQPYFNWKVTPFGYAPEYAYRAGEALYEAVKKGRVIEADKSDEMATAVHSDEI